MTITVRKLSGLETLALFPDLDTLRERPTLTPYVEEIEQLHADGALSHFPAAGGTVRRLQRRIRELEAAPVESVCVLKDGHHFVRFRDRWDDGREHCTGCGEER
jgi:hypothetical protein